MFRPRLKTHVSFTLLWGERNLSYSSWGHSIKNYKPFVTGIMLLLLILCSSSILRSQSLPSDSWRYRFGTGGIFAPFDVAFDDDANSYAVFTTSRGGVENNSVWVVKLNATGTQELYRMTLAVESSHFAKAVDVDSAGQAVVLWTGGLTKISANGTGILYYTSPGVEDPSDIVVDALGNAYVAGKLSVNGQPGGDAAVAKTDPSGMTEWVRTIGGSATDVALGLALGTDGGIYLTGRTSSADFPATAGGRTFSGGSVDAFVAKLDAQGTVVYSTCVGGSGFDEGMRIKLDSSGNSYVVGKTSSTDFPTLNPFQAALLGSEDAFVAKLDPAGLISYSTFLGGNAWDQGLDVAVDSIGNASITGITGSADFPMFQATQTTYAGNWQGFITTLNQFGDSVLYSTYDSGGANRFNQGTTIAYDAADNLYVGILSHGYSGGGEYPELAKLAKNRPPSAEAGPDQVIEATGSLTQVTIDGLASIDPNGDALLYQWTDDNGAEVGDMGQLSLSLGVGTHVFTLTVTDPRGATDVDTVSILIRDTFSPMISVTAPTSATYLLNETVLSNYSCSDSGTGIASCTGSVANGTSINTATVGTKTFSVLSLDGAGNSSTSSTTYSVTYRVFMLYNTTQNFNAKTKPLIKIQLQDFGSANRSSGAVSVTALRVSPRGNPNVTAKPLSGSFTFDSALTFSGAAPGGGYRYTLDASGLASGAYDLLFSVANDPVVHAAPFIIK